MKTICKFSKNMLVKSQKSKQRIVEVCRVLCAFVGYLLERKIYFLRYCPFGVFSSASTWGHKIFSIIFKILWQWKVERGYCGTKISSKLALFASFRCLPIEGTFFADTIQFANFCPYKWDHKMFFQLFGGFSSFSPATNWGDIFSQDKFGVFDSVYKWADLASQFETRTCEAIIGQNG